MKEQDDLICVCNEVYLSVIEDVIINGGCRTLEEIQSKTSAGTVCGGCVDDINDILKKTIEENNL